MAAKLFEQKYITVGTLLAIFLSTSDEAFIILLSSGKGAVWLLPLIAVKIVVGVAVGYAADGILKGFGRRQTRVESSRGKYLDEARSHAHSEHAHHSHGAVSSPSEGAQGVGAPCLRIAMAQFLRHPKFLTARFLLRPKIPAIRPRTNCF